MAKRKVSNPLAFAVLGCLGERPMHPYEISTLLRTRGKDLSIKLNYGSLYSVVGALMKQGLIEALETVREGNRPERTVYAITPAGRAEFDAWLTELLGSPVREFSQLEAGLAYLPAFPPDRVADLLEQRATALETSIDELETMLQTVAASSLPRLFVIESEFRLAMLRAELGYVTGLVKEIRDETLDGIAVWRRSLELVATGLTFQEIFGDPMKYFGEEGRWLTELPKEAGQPP